MISDKEVKQLVSDIISDTPYFLVKVRVGPGNKIFVAIDSYNNVTIDECAEVSQKLYEKIQAIDDDFELEVSSPGLTSPFEVIEQYKKYKNSEIEVLLKNGQKVNGILGETFENGFNVSVERKLKDPITRKKTNVVENLFLEFEAIKQTRRKVKF